MATLLLRLAGPLQAWGVDSKFETRRTENLPTKSGVIGLVAAALGRRRDESVDDLCSLRFGVRVDQEGSLLRDYHIARNTKDSYQSNRWYLEDAVFLVGLESEDHAFLESLRQAMLFPAFPLFLGRRACPPELPLCLGIVEDDLLTALRAYPWQASETWRRKHPSADLRLVTDGNPEDFHCGAARDVPISFSPLRREYGWRKVKEHKPVHIGDSHDPMAEL